MDLKDAQWGMKVVWPVRIRERALRFKSNARRGGFAENVTPGSGLRSLRFSPIGPGTFWMSAGRIARIAGLTPTLIRPRAFGCRPLRGLGQF